MLIVKSTYGLRNLSDSGAGSACNLFVTFTVPRKEKNLERKRADKLLCYIISVNYVPGQRHLRGSFRISIKMLIIMI